MNDRTSDPNGQEKHVIAKSGALKSITIHILPELAFDEILGYPTIKRYNLLSAFYSLFCETDLQVHNCKSCRQCLPAVFQQESSLASGATQAEVLFEPP